MKNSPSALILLFIVQCAHCMDLNIDNEDAFLAQASAVLDARVDSIEPIEFVESGRSGVCGFKVHATVIEEIYRAKNSGSSEFEFLVNSSRGVSIGSEYLLITQKIEGSTGEESQNAATRCLRRRGEDLLVGVPQSLLLVEPALFELTGSKWLRASPRNVLGESEPTLKRLQFMLISDSQNRNTLQSLEDFYWLSYDELKFYLEAKFGD